MSKSSHGYDFRDHLIKSILRSPKIRPKNLNLYNLFGLSMYEITPLRLLSLSETEYSDSAAIIPISKLHSKEFLKDKEYGNH